MGCGAYPLLAGQASCTAAPSHPRRHGGEAPGRQGRLLWPLLCPHQQVYVLPSAQGAAPVGGAGRGLWQQPKWEGLSLSRACLPGYLGSPHTASQAPLFLRCGWHHVLSSVCLCPFWGPHQGPGGGERECFKCPLMVFCRNKCSRFRVDPSLSPQVTSFWVSVSESPLPLPRCLSPSVSPSPSTEEWEAALGQQGLCCSRYLGQGLRALAAGRLWASCPGRGELAFPHPAQRLTRWRLVGTEKA